MVILFWNQVIYGKNNLKHPWVNANGSLMAPSFNVTTEDFASLEASIKRYWTSKSLFFSIDEGTLTHRSGNLIITTIFQD